MLSRQEHLNGLVAAVVSPFDQNGQMDPRGIPACVDRLIAEGISGLYVCGSTGEGVSMTTAERQAVAEAYVDATAKRVSVIVQIGHNSIAEAQALGAHALDCGATAISATCPSYFAPRDTKALVATMAEVASSAPSLPFYYYHIPALTGAHCDMPTFLAEAADQIPNLAGIKFTDLKLHEFQSCQQVDSGRFDIVWGCDEMLLGALATGARAAIGSTYNIAAPLYLQLIESFHAGDLKTARTLQFQSIAMIRILNQYPFHAALKAVLEWRGYPTGPCRLPLGNLDEGDADRLRRQLVDAGLSSIVSASPHASASMNG